MELIKYKSYSEYKKAQIAANQRKLKNVYVNETVIQFICGFLSEHKGDIKFGLCHGTRRGVEQQLFKKYLNCKVLGTEISTTAKQFPDTIEWDFHDVKPEWVNACDFIYTNSLDHAMDPHKAVKSWLSCLSSGGYLIIEWAETVRKRPKQAKKSDPFMAEYGEVIDLVQQMGGHVETIQKLEDYPNSNKAHLLFIRRGK